MGKYTFSQEKNYDAITIFLCFSLAVLWDGFKEQFTYCCLNSYLASKCQILTLPYMYMERKKTDNEYSTPKIIL